MKATIDFSNVVGKIKPMHAVNNGPKKAPVEQKCGNFETYKAAKIPYARTHDASFCAAYGGEHTVDVHAFFPDFSKNPYDENSYDFTLTDEYLQTIVDAGTQVYYRLGSKIEHWSKKYGTIVPADFHKWAVICEHIIRHYNEGWANGFHFNIIYWEIWNEADGVAMNGDHPNWSGTAEEYYEFYVEAASHLKKRFPHLKIGGPALSYLGNREWLAGFLNAIKQSDKKVPLDFFSWHSYTNDPMKVKERAEQAREILDNAGFTNTETHLNEINYLKAGWGDRFDETIDEIGGIRGAVFHSCIMAVGQKSSLDMLMYYDARLNTGFNGLFAPYTYRPLKGYYALSSFSKLYDLKNEVKSESDDKDLYVVASSDEDKQMAIISFYNADFARAEEKLNIEIKNKDRKYNLFLLDADNTLAPISYQESGNSLLVSIKPDSVVVVESID